jgi:hypothetical protein
MSRPKMNVDSGTVQKADGLEAIRVGSTRKRRLKSLFNGSA